MIMNSRKKVRQGRSIGSMKVGTCWVSLTKTATFVQRLKEMSCMIFGRSPEGMSSGHSNISLEMNGTVMSMWFFWLIQTWDACISRKGWQDQVFSCLFPCSLIFTSLVKFIIFFPLIPHISTDSGNSFQILTCLSMSLIFTIEHVFAIFC